MGHTNKAVSFYYFCHTFKGFSLPLRFCLYTASTMGVFQFTEKNEQMQTLSALCFWLMNLISAIPVSAGNFQQLTNE